MFVSNLAPITLIAAAAQPSLTQTQIAVLLQNAMFVAGIATLVQLYPVWKIGSKLPVVMGVSFTFVTVLCTVAANYGYPAVVGSVIIGGLDRKITGEEISGSLACDGYASAFSALFGCPPVTSFSQNVGLVAYGHSENRKVIICL